MSVGLVATALRSNIPTGVLVDCCFLVSSAVFQLFVVFSGFTALHFAGIQQSSRNFIWGGSGYMPQQGDGAPMHPLFPFATRMGPCRGAQGAEGVRSGSGEGAMAQKA